MLMFWKNMSCRLIRGSFRIYILTILERHAIAGERTMAFREALVRMYIRKLQVK